ncbi:MAG: helix-turn-helix domain-containing protein [Verrucomicrobiota bacterium]
MNPHFSVEEIAEELGFPSAARFIDEFERQTGHLPSDYQLLLPV